MKRLVTIIWCFCCIAVVASAGDWNRAPFSGGVEMPKAAIHSTSAMPSINSVYCSNPLIGEDGLALNGMAPKKGTVEVRGNARRSGHTPIIDFPDDETDDYLDFPLGDAVLPLMLMTICYIVFRMRRRQKVLAHA